MKVKSDIISSITTNPIGQAMIIFIETFKTVVIVFISNVMCLMSH